MQPLQYYAFVALALLVLLAFFQVDRFGSNPGNRATPPLDFATEYARELVSLEEVRARGESDLKDTADASEKLASGIHFSTLMQLELRSQIQILRSMHLAGEFASLIPEVIAFDQQKIDLYEQMIDILTEFVSGPKPGVDFGKVAAQMPKIRAELEDVDHTLFADVTPLVCMTLLNMHVDSKNHVSHLVISRSQKAELIKKLVSGFGKDLDDGSNKNFTVGSGLVMKSFLEGHQSSDDSWK